jgi:hypothetical protein
MSLVENPGIKESGGHPEAMGQYLHGLHDPQSGRKEPTEKRHPVWESHVETRKSSPPEARMSMKTQPLSGEAERFRGL